MKIKRTVKNVLTAQQNKAYEKALEKRRVSFDTWIRQREAGRRQVLQGAHRNGDLVYLCAGYGHGCPDRDVEAVCADYFSRHPEVLIAYGDEDVWEEAQGPRRSPWFKPAWSPDLFDCSFYFGSLTVIQSELFDRARLVWGEALSGEKGFVRQSDGAWLYADMLSDGSRDRFIQFMHICVGLAGGYVAGRTVIGHISEILFHCEDEAWMEEFLPDERIKSRFFDLQIREFSDGFFRNSVYPKERGQIAGAEPVVSVIIPSKDHPDILSRCIEGIRGTLIKPLPCEIIVVDNGSGEKNRALLEERLEAFRLEEMSVRYIYEEAEFNFSRMCNLGAARAAGRYLLFLNDDVELRAGDCIFKMAAMADRDYTGAVGMKLYYPESVRIQHAGITNLPMGPVHKLQFLEDNMCYYHGINAGARNVIAVTAACLMVEKKKFDEVGGFPEELRVAFNDVDLCFSLFERGYYNVCLNDCCAYHHESLSRGDDESEENLSRLLSERDRLYRRHPGLEGKDPFYPEGLGRDGLDTGVRPEYETAGNFLQESEVPDQIKSLEEYRHDACLLFRVEWSQGDGAEGYGVVLGDNNACYDRELLLADIKDEKRIYAVKLEGQYRPDLAENMPDQINVGLSGFRVKLGGAVLRGGTFRIGMAVRNRVTGTKLYYFSNRTLKHQ